MAGVLISRGEEAGIHEGRRARDDRCRNWSAAAASQGISRIAGKPSEARKRPGRILLYRFQRQHDPANTLILDF